MDFGTVRQAGAPHKASERGLPVPPPSESCPRFPLRPPRLPRPLLMKPFVFLEPFLAPSCRCLTKAARAPRGKQEGLSFLLLLQDPVQLLESRCGCGVPDSWCWEESVADARCDQKL